jgi:hypothetical protein
MMDKIEEKLKSLVLENVDFVLDGKSIKRGKLKLFNTKQFFIRFKLEYDGELKDWELPYPYKLEQTVDGYVFNYCLSAFCPPTELAFYKMKMVNKNTASKLHDMHLRVFSVPVGG